MKELTYKEEYVLNHGEKSYAEKLAKNAAWRKANPLKAEEYAEKRSRKGSGKGKTVLLISDVHIGSQTTDIDEIKALAKKYWQSKPIILLGDLIDAGIDRGMQFDNSYDPQESVDIVKEIFQPLNIIGYRLGNHEQRVSKLVGINVYKHIFNMEEATTVTVNGREIYFSHGRSAAENMFLEFQKIVKWCSSDLVGMGHSHDLARITFMRGDKIQHLVRTGSFLKREKYAINANYAPKIRGWAEYDTERNVVYLKAINDKTGEIFDL